MPIDYIRGNISGRQDLTYDGGEAYSVSGKVAAANYQPRLVAKVLRLTKPDMIRYYQIRTRSSVNMTAAQKHNLAVMGGAGALFAGIVSNKQSNAYLACVRDWSEYGTNKTFREYVMGILRQMLIDKDELCDFDGFELVNPWVSQETPSVPVKQSIIDKFASELS